MARPLRDVRRKKLYSQRDLAREADITASTVYLIESHRTIPQLGSMRRICEVLGVEPTEISEFADALDRLDSRLTDAG